MSNEIKLVGFRAPIAYHEKIKTHADSTGLSISDFLRDAVEHALNGVKSDVKSDLTLLEKQFDVKDRQIEDLSRQLEDGNRRHEETQRASEEAAKRSDMLLAQMTQQLDRTQLQLEDMRNRQTQSWWGRMFGRKG